MTLVVMIVVGVTSYSPHLMSLVMYDIKTCEEQAAKLNQTHDVHAYCVQGVDAFPR